MDIRTADKDIEPLLCRVEYRRPPEWEDPESLDGIWPHDEANRAMAYTAKERDEIVAALEAAHIAYRVLAEDQPDPALLARMQGRDLSREAALEILATGKVPPTIDEIAERVEELEARPVTEAERVQ